MEFRARLEEFSLPTLIQVLCREDVTGIATVKSIADEARFFVQSGRIVFARVGCQGRIGARLVSKGVVSQADVDRALAWQKTLSERRPLATVLVEMGVVPKEVLDAELSEHIKAVVETVHGWTEGELSFYSLEISPELIVLQDGVDPSAWAASTEEKCVSSGELVDVTGELATFLP
jgi:hypothetical protein